jgi:hypothetical protein
MTEKLNDTGGHKIVNGAEKYWKVILIVFCAGALQAQVYFNSKELDTRRDKVDEIAVIKSDLSTVKKDVSYNRKRIDELYEIIYRQFGSSNETAQK